ncbi:MAG TPA: C69 family dipeptidase [Candidatus Desulfaltia sp.]|nr:C69 family dipeptidase [Candidatus Desulfaltia sp.]
MRTKILVLRLGLVILAGCVLAGLLAIHPNSGNPPPENEAENCTVVMVGKDASTDGSVMTTHAADCGVCDWTWRHVPAADHQPGETRKIYHVHQIRTWPPSEGLKWDLYKNDFTGLEIPQVPRTFAFHHGVFGYQNEHQLSIGEATIGNARKISNRTPAAKLDITMLTLLAMERCRTAREAVRFMGGLAEQHGYGFHDGGEMLAVADPREVWIFEIMPVGPLWTPESGQPGAAWCAQRVPDDHVSVCPNESRIDEVDLNNTDYFLGSAHMISFAVEQGLYDPKSGQSFSFKRAYSPSQGSAKSNPRRARLWRFFDLVAPSRKFSPDMANMEFPFSVKPDKKLSVQDVMTIMRDKCAGTEFDPLRGLRGGPFGNPYYDSSTRTIGTNHAEYTTVTQSRSAFPGPIGGLVWLALGSQDTSCFVPFYAGITDMPDSYKIGDHWVFSRDSARWAFDYTDFHAQVVYNAALEDVKEAQDKWETSAIARTPEIDKQALDLYSRDPAKAAEFLTGYCLDNACSVVNAWWELGDRLLVKYNKLGTYNIEKRSTEGSKTRTVPDWWEKMVKVYDAILEPADR